LSSNPINEDLSVWQKSELDKSLTEIENGKIQSENWGDVRERFFEQYTVNS
jgi:hypothetical protein